MYQGYPFDRLRHRLGMELEHPDSVDPLDLSCASLPELQELNPEDLDDTRLADAFKSAAGFRDDTLTTRFAAELVRRRPAGLHELDLTMVYAPLVRQAMQRSNPAEALQWLDQARVLGSESTRRSFDTWRAEILSRTGQPDEAARIYHDLVASAPSAAQVALDAAETFLDNGHHDQARSFLKRARDLARTAKVSGVEDLANRHLKSLT
jgi:predicted Zn-dependent protease